MKYNKLGLGVAALGFAVALAGCGGGNNGILGPKPNPTAAPTAVPSNQRFNGTYTGYFAGADAQGNNVNGSFDSNVAGAGVVNGSVTQQGLLTFAATGIIDDNGVVNVTAGDPNNTGFLSTLKGNATLASGDSVIAGTLTTNSGGNPEAVRGIFAAIRSQATPTPFAGAYSGSFDGTGADGAKIQGTITGSVNNDGAISGSVTQAGFGQYPAVGTIDRAGNVSLRAITTFPGQPSVLILSTLTGKATVGSGAASPVTVEGNFNTTANGQSNASGTFKVTRNGTI